MPTLRLRFLRVMATGDARRPALSSAGRAAIGGYTRDVPKRDPHDVLGVARGASQSSIKAAWRRLAREHHPDLSPGDAAAARAATRRMAEINQAYEQLRIGSPG